MPDVPLYHRGEVPEHLMTTRSWPRPAGYRAIWLAPTVTCWWSCSTPAPGARSSWRSQQHKRGVRPLINPGAPLARIGIRWLCDTIGAPSNREHPA